MKLNDMLVDISECNEGSDVCEFYIESKLLANIVGRLIDATELDLGADKNIGYFSAPR